MAHHEAQEARNGEYGRRPGAASGQALFLLHVRRIINQVLSHSTRPLRSLGLLLLDGFDQPEKEHYFAMAIAGKKAHD